MANGTQPLQSPEVQALLKDSAKLKEMLSSPEVRQLAEMLNARSGGDLKRAATAAKAGNTEQLAQMMKGLSATGEGAQLLASLQRKLEK